jgi:hypothetical protein
LYTKNSTIFIENVKRFSVNSYSIDFVDKSETRISIEPKDIVRLYEALKLTIERNGSNFEDYCDKLFSTDLIKFLED